VRMRPLVRTLQIIGAGGEVTTQDRVRARSVLSEVSLLVVIVNLVGFFLGPILSISMESLTAGKPFSLLELGLYVALNLSIGIMAALQEITLIDATMTQAREALGIVELSHGRGEIGVRTWLFLVTIGSSFLACTLVTMAGLGFYTQLLHAAQASGVSQGRFVAQLSLLTVVVVGWAFVLTATAARNLITQITSLGSRMHQIAAGEADLSRRVPIVRFDEVGKLTSAINSVIARLQGLVLQVRDAAERVAASGRSLTGTTQEAGTSVERLASSLDRVQVAVTNQNQTVEASNQTISRLSASIDAISHQVTTQASFVEESSAAMTQIAASITSVSKVAEQANSIARSLNERSPRRRAPCRKPSV